MEPKQILHQRFQYADIIPYRDHSKLTQRPKNLGMNTFDVEDVTEEQDEDDLFGEKIRWVSLRQNVTVPLYAKEQLPKKRQNTRIFYADEECDIRIPLTQYFKKKKRHLTTNDRQIKSHYCRPFSSINISTYERTIYQKGDTLTVKTNFYSKNRYFNCKYFKTYWETEGFSINLRTGNFITFSKTKISSKFPRVRKNVFPFLMDVLNTHLLDYKPRISNLTDKSTPERTKDKMKIEVEFKRELNDFEFIQTLSSYFLGIPDLKLDPFPNSTLTNENVSNWFLNTMINLFIHIKKIKVPNNFYSLIIGWYPTQKYLKKNDNKLVAAILSRLGIKSKQTIRILHENPEMDITRLFGLTKYFGNEFHQYLGNIYPGFFRGKSPKIKNGKEKRWYEQLAIGGAPYPISDIEKTNVLKLLNELTKTSKSDNDTFGKEVENQVRLIDDHFQMILKLKEYYPDVALRATNWKNFSEEHMMFSRLENLIKRGYTTEFIFEEELVEYIEAPILTKEETFYPVLLKMDAEYTEEGSHMHHCVGGYAERDSTIIISLRMGSIWSGERITCEYNTYNKKPNQSRYFCNANPPEHFTEALEMLHNKIFNYSDSIKSKELVRTKLEPNKPPNGNNILFPVNENGNPIPYIVNNPF